MGDGSLSLGQPVIAVEDVSKSFVLKRNRTRSLSELLSLSRRGAVRVAATEEFWALKDVSFTVRPGESVGIVGHNGSGKSTMLKILTGIMKPTSGSVKVHGRIGALIEVGAGFHPDLSGRENIFLNGSILGLSRREIAAKFDQIVDFAGLQRFIDTPVKRYSSGMYMRLGFSIAVHTDPQILLIDEVLAVGDTFFQRKCLRRLEEFVANGGAAIFVSHGMAQVAELCQKCVWLDHGQARFIGDTNDAISHYMAVVTEREDAEFRREHPEEWEALEAARRLEQETEEQERADAELAEVERIAAQQAEKEAARLSDPTKCRILGVTLRDSRGIASTRVTLGEPVRIDITYQFGRSLPDPIFGIDFFRDDGLHMFTTSNYDHSISLSGLPLTGVMRLYIDSLVFGTGAYRVQVNLFSDSSSPNWFDSPEDQISDALNIFVISDDIAHGCVSLTTRWELFSESSASGLAPGASKVVVFDKESELLEAGV